MEFDDKRSKSKKLLELGLEQKISVKPVNRSAGFGMELPCLYELRGDSFSINWVSIKIEGKKKSLNEACTEDRRQKRKLK